MPAALSPDQQCSAWPEKRIPHKELGLYRPLSDRDLKRVITKVVAGARNHLNLLFDAPGLAKNELIVQQARSDAVVSTTDLAP
jgi:hypothetical protein